MKTNLARDWNKLINWFKKLPAQTWLYLAWLIILIIQTPIFLGKPDHFAYNLEPYPDSIFYAIGARNLVQGKGYGLFYQGEKLAIITPPLYVVVLAAFAWIPSPIYFVVPNLILGLATAWLLYLIIKKIGGQKNSWWLVPTGLALYFSHAMISWFVNVAMIENLGLFLIMLLLYFLLNVDAGWKQTAGLFVTGLLLMIAKYTFMPLMAAILVIIAIKLIQQKQIKILLGAVIVTILAFLVASVCNPVLMKEVNDGIHGLLQGGSSPYYDFKFVASNTRSLIQLLIGKYRVHFLWIGQPMSSFLIFGLYSLATLLSFIKKENWLNNLYILLLALSQLPLQIIFWVFDSRYLLLWVPLAVVGIIYDWSLLVDFFNRKALLSIIVVGIALILHLKWQRSFWSFVLNNNWRHASKAWSYTGAQTLNKFMADKPQAKMVSGLFPYYFSYLANDDSAIYLPMSNQQEFYRWLPAEKAWGTTPNYDLILKDPLLYVQSLLENNEEIYISNLSITGSERIIGDYEEFKKTFKAEKVDYYDCDGVCEIYRLTLKNKVVNE